jgi:hypothetical protein
MRCNGRAIRAACSGGPDIEGLGQHLTPPYVDCGLNAAEDPLRYAAGANSFVAAVVALIMVNRSRNDSFPLSDRPA